VHPDITERLEAVKQLCHRFHVRRLHIFGSMATGQDRPGESDVDFLVEFEPLGPGMMYETYFGLLEGLEALFGRHVDLVDASAIKNPYFRESVDESKKLLYAAA
jgi:predicted nucleotidyltransferase